MWNLKTSKQRNPKVISTGDRLVVAGEMAEGVRRYK